MNQKSTFWILLTLYSILTSSLAIAQTKEDWVKSKISSMSLEQKVGQLFMIRASSNDDQNQVEAIKNYISKYHVGGLCFFQGTAKRQIELTNIYQELSNIPLFIAMDAEWGPSMRLSSEMTSLPYQLTMGAVPDETLVYQMGSIVAKQLKVLGVNINFAPVADVNINPKNPVIGYRSFGEDKKTVARLSYYYAKALEESNILSCAKHFPGHGDTDVDSHLDLPILNHSKARLNSIELMPFKYLANKNIGSMMVAHLHIPAFDKRKNRPASLSAPIIKGILRKEMKYEGIIFTDGMEMKGVTKHFNDDIAAVEAILAGNDIVLLPNNFMSAYKGVLKNIKSGKIKIKDIDESLNRILKKKYEMGLKNKVNPISADVERKHFDTKKLNIFLENVYEQSLTLVANNKQLLPFKGKLNRDNFATLSLGSDHITPFQDRLGEYLHCSHFAIPDKTPKNKYFDIVDKLCNKKNVIISLHNLNNSFSKNFGISDEELNIIHTLSTQTNIVLVIFGNPYSLKNFNQSETVLVAYQDNPKIQDITAQSIMGANPIVGKLPVTASHKYKLGTTNQLPSYGRLGYSLPESQYIDSEIRQKVDGLMEEMIATYSAPGSQVIIAKNNKIVFQKNYGHHTYDTSKLEPVQSDHIYDMASLTKILSSTFSLMKLESEYKFDHKKKLGDYLHLPDNNNKSKLELEDILSHKAGLTAWIPFYKETMINTGSSSQRIDQYYCDILTEDYPYRINDSLYLSCEFNDSIWTKIYNSSVNHQQGYKYSDLGFIMIPKVIEAITHRSFENYVSQDIFEPLGLVHTTFNPIQKGVASHSIIPSEKDTYFRNKKVRGYVHDMGAAMLGGVSGHAGLFSNAYETAVLFQLLLNGGNYGPEQLISPSVIKTYTTRVKGSTRRGLGFDLKDLNPNNIDNMHYKASKTTYGHTGFTGTAAYADPDNNLIIVLLANRTYPTMDNKGFINGNYRSRLQEIVYDAITKNCPSDPDINQDNNISMPNIESEL